MLSGSIMNVNEMLETTATPIILITLCIPDPALCVFTHQWASDVILKNVVTAVNSQHSFDSAVETRHNWPALCFPYSFYNKVLIIKQWTDLQIRDHFWLYPIFPGIFSFC